jgi:hypothetical protein
MDNVAFLLLLLAVLGAGLSFGLLVVLLLRGARYQVARINTRRIVRRRLQLMMDGRL